ncbi:hypothetical protein AC579_4353 [Pseudocercospora musae]|uniref:Dol-P-Glc:Glc(2)Man(9)GlcNAc(2)-PP-Dol alpha-1,2-glucosyltransferase n=1 Tax=Pseudocercospora musae TaxID=113226 RepID=A0A139IQG2_9PEZI|nr:hypothetical protein AC579_4353 [Pseudocercospora musae]
MATEAASLLSPLFAWYNAVNNAVQEPYLDEVFHIRQAQHFCADHWDVWDPKITTPPGLYLLSVLFRPLLGCDVRNLRLLNAICLVALMLVLRATYNVRRQNNNQNGHLSGILAYHSAVNIVLFPPLFFFSALYYTDVASTLSVVVFYWYFLQIVSNRQGTVKDAVVQVMLGVISLTFRQTNIFWVSIMPAALSTFMNLDQGHKVVKESMYRRAEGFGDTTWSVAKTSWKMNVVYDPPVRDAFVEDYFRTIISVAACGARAATQLARLSQLVQTLMPYLTTLAIFAGFIVWNGGVVLGDKSNHVATINLPQMLYLWPFLAFFSWPLLLPQFILVPITILSRVPGLASIEPMISFRRRFFLPRLWVAAAFVGLACLIVHFNTVVHPFMLADNRHYHFYIFKRLLRPQWIRYAVTPIYVLTAWACIETRGEAGTIFRKMVQPAAASKSSSKEQIGQTTSGPLKSNATEDAERHATRLPDGNSTAMVSFILVFIITTALSLCTAPLVEPRYCIIPYVVWRMHFPLSAGSRGKQKDIWGIMAAYDYRVVLETVWFLAINAMTGYIFVNWTFEWPSEPGQLQRFMW